MQRPVDSIFFGPSYQRHAWYPEGEIQTIANFGPMVEDACRRRADRYGDRTDLSKAEQVALW